MTDCRKPEDAAPLQRLLTTPSGAGIAASARICGYALERRATGARRDPRSARHRSRDTGRAVAYTGRLACPRQRLTGSSRTSDWCTPKPAMTPEALASVALPICRLASPAA